MKIQSGNISSRLWFFILSSSALFFFFFAYDSPSPMYSGLREIFGDRYEEYHNLLYAAYAVPNLLLPLLFNLSDNSEPAKMVYTYALIVAGQSIFCLGVGMGVFELMLAGRFIVGLGGESFSIAQNKMLASLFSPHEHGKVFGLCLSIGRLGSILAYLLLGTLIEQGAFVCALISTALVWLGGLFILITYRKWEVKWQECCEPLEEEEVHHLLPFFIAMTVLLACATSPFSSNNSAILQKRLGIDFKQASRALAFQEATALIFTIFISIATDKFGHRLSCICLGTLFLTLGHSMIFYSSPLYWISVFLLGMSSALQACSWPCYPLLLSQSKLAIGLSLLSCFINLAYSACPPIISRISDPSFRVSEYCSTFFAGMSSVIALYIVFANSRHRYGLNGIRHYRAEGKI
ncbi:uncharacterized protein NEMAJ01_1448 [Nematocida major]|uniref:uncharacterized protein n=1 Tax=Nematocida major TaxID=1912982 RepID=UPI00200835A0|nr:uncharacterized protein NEMAJ01_1448 [Nematocida major]KAH9386552.1 hypothetical protein NEMAJ01_1448 [Nematocida major]